MKRLPIHPRPLPHEALSSWIDRLAGTYDLPPWTFMERAFGYSLSDRALDLAPPGGLLLTISERTGVPAGKLHAMTLAGYAPLLLDTMTPVKGLFETYVGQFPTLVPIGDRFRRPVFRLDESRWVPWILPDRREHPPLCRQCVGQDDTPYRRIYWRAAWMSCCPTHREMLETGYFLPSRRNDLYAYKPRRSASDKVVALDGLTLQAVCDGTVSLEDGRKINAAVWLRALRGLLDELIRPLYILGSAKKIVTTAWQLAGVPVHDGLRMDRILEDLPNEQREKIFAVAAGTVDRLLNNGFEIARGQLATIFDPVPALPERDLPSRPPRGAPKPRPAPSIDWEGTWTAAVAAAKRSPLEAYYLRALMIWNRPPSETEEVDTRLRELGIPLVMVRPDLEGHMSQKQIKNSFA